MRTLRGCNTHLCFTEETDAPSRKQLPQAAHSRAWGVAVTLPSNPHLASALLASRAYGGDGQGLDATSSQRCGGSYVQLGVGRLLERGVHELALVSSHSPDPWAQQSTQPTAHYTNNSQDQTDPSPAPLGAVRVPAPSGFRLNEAREHRRRREAGTCPKAPVSRPSSLFLSSSLLAPQAQEDYPCGHQP